jgi:hypothetical protein
LAAAGALPSTLTPLEKSVIKALLHEGWRNQDIQALINTGRAATINSGRITGVKNDSKIKPATKSDVDEFRRRRALFDHQTGLDPFFDERLVRAREAMILAVELFNTPRIRFKAGVFAMLANVAWTYLLHEFYERHDVDLIDDKGYSLLLSQMVERHDCPVSLACRKNLQALKKIRDVVEHLTIGPFDKKWLTIFQATCLNFEKYLTEWFGQQLTLGHDLGFALQFARLSINELSSLQQYDLPPHIAALDAGLRENLTPDEADNLEYQFKVVYTLAGASKSQAHFQFIQPDSAEGVEIQNVLVKFKPADELYPLRPTDVVREVRKQLSRPFTTDKHQKAWKLYKARPRPGAKDPAATNRTYAIYHAAHRDYTYSHEWVAFLVQTLKDDDEWLKLVNFVPKIQ